MREWDHEWERRAAATAARAEACSYAEESWRAEVGHTRARQRMRGHTWARHTWARRTWARQRMRGACPPIHAAYEKAPITCAGRVLLLKSRPILFWPLPLWSVF